MTLFALLHGGMHDGSSWEQVACELRAHGHETVAPDLPVDDDSAGAEEWSRIAIEAINSAVGTKQRDIVIVGHSIAGLCVPVVAARREARLMVFVAGLIPVIGHSFAEHLTQHPAAVTFPLPSTEGEGPFGLDFQTVRDAFYHDVESDLARQAFGRLRGQSFTIITERCPISTWPDVPSAFIIMSDDKTVDPAWLREQAQQQPRNKLIDMEGGHSPMFARPRLLGSLLAGIAELR